MAEARQQGFRLAVEQVIGTVIASETHAQNQQMVRDEIVTYASGFVDRFEIQEAIHGSGWVRLRMQVWVKRTDIAGRLLHQGAVANAVDGQQIATQIQTHQQQAAQGDALLRLVMQDYPNRAFDLQHEPVRVILDSNRDANLSVTVSTRWSHTYMEALDQALRAVNPNPRCASWFFNCRGLMPHVEMGWRAMSRSGAWFNDRVSYEEIRRPLEDTVIVYRLVLVMRGQAPKTFCFLPEWKGHKMFLLDTNRVHIDGYDRVRQTLSLNLRSFPIDRLLETQIDIVPQNQCFYAP